MLLLCGPAEQSARKTSILHSGRTTFKVPLVSSSVVMPVRVQPSLVVSDSTVLPDTQAVMLLMTDGPFTTS